MIHIHFNYQINTSKLFTIYPMNVSAFKLYMGNVQVKS